MTGLEIYALANEIIMDAYAAAIDEPDTMLIDRVCLTSGNVLAFVTITTSSNGDGTFQLPAHARDYRSEAFRWLTSERNQGTHSGIRFDVICINTETRCGKLFENAF